MQQTIRLVAVLVAALAVVRGAPLEPEIVFTTTPKPLDPKHVPQSVCMSMLPAHGNAKPQDGVVPYTIETSVSDNGAQRVVQVRVSGVDGAQFKGIYLQARSSENGSPAALGSFTPSNNPVIVVSDCPPGTNNAISYITRQDTPSATFTWEVPQDLDGSVMFKATIVKSFSEFWINVDSTPLTFTWAAVSTCLGPIRDPPHQNSVRLGPWRKMAAIQGQRPGSDSDPPTTRNLGTSGWPHSATSWLCSHICCHNPSSF